MCIYNIHLDTFEEREREKKTFTEVMRNEKETFINAERRDEEDEVVMIIILSL